MRDIEIELRVLNAIRSLRAGSGGEDDAVEFKEMWPQPPAHAARQLAGMANRRAGQTFFLVIGIHDRSGKHTEPAAVSLGDWYAQAEKQFDDLAPRMVSHLQVTIGDDEHVQVLVFDSSRFPYVVKVEDKTNYTEVPIRVGTTTRGMRRHELMELLAPNVDTANAEIRHAEFSARWEDELRDGEPNENAVTLSAKVNLHVSYFNDRPLHFSTDALAARIALGGLEAVPKRIRISHAGNGAWQRDVPQARPANFGVHVDGSQIYVASSGAIVMMFSWQLGRNERPTLLESWRQAISHQNEARLDIAFRPSGSSRPVMSAAPLERYQPAIRRDRLDSGPDREAPIDPKRANFKLVTNEFHPWD